MEELDAGSRLDRLLGRLLAPKFSRSWLSALIEQGSITVDGRTVRPSFRAIPGQVVEGDIGHPAEVLPAPEPMDLTILFEDDALVVVDKPVGVVIHPGTGKRTGTLVNGLLDRYPEIGRVGRADRPGIVHRLDRDTTGVMVVARSNDAAKSLVNQFKRRTVTKQYAAVVWGEMPFDSDWIELPLGAHPRMQALRAVVTEGGQAASSFYQVNERLGVMTYVEVSPRTGRTHQIRVHLEHLGFPIVKDSQYGRDAQASYAHWVETLRKAGKRVPIIERHALHAHRLTVDHPLTGERVTFEAPLPADMADLIEVARESA
ncbi:MAG: RluA family pseudouridine synthase [Planctomycetota bacterium]